MSRCFVPFLLLVFLLPAGGCRKKKPEPSNPKGIAKANPVNRGPGDDWRTRRAKPGDGRPGDRPERRSDEDPVRGTGSGPATGSRDEAAGTDSHVQGAGEGARKPAEGSGPAFAAGRVSGARPGGSGGQAGSATGGDASKRSAGAPVEGAAGAGDEAGQGDPQPRATGGADAPEGGRGPDDREPDGPPGEAGAEQDPAAGGPGTGVSVPSGSADGDPPMTLEGEPAPGEPGQEAPMPCATNDDCDDGIACTIDFCDPATRTCMHKGDCCFSIADCDDSDPCTIDICDSVANKCSYREMDCDDQNLCTEDWCEPYGGCRYTPSLSCSTPCQRMADCDDGDLCTEDMCDLPQNICVFVAIRCEDDDPCTREFCAPQQGCVIQDLPGCELCRSAADCPLPSDNNCLTAACDPQAEKCVFTQKKCDDQDPCTNDYCVPATGECQADFICCDEDSDCDPGNACSTGKCTGGHCQLSPIACSDDNPCTIDSCDTDVGCIHETMSNCQAAGKGR